MSGHPRFLLVMLAVGALFLGACGGNDKTPSGGGSNTPAGATVAVAVQEWSVLPTPGTAAAGKVTFNVKNTGTMTHEFVVVKTDLDPGALPTKADGSVNEDGTGFTAVGELEDIEVGKSKSTTFDLAAGKYVLFCNVVEEKPMANMGGIKSHYKLGMHTGFTVS